MTQSTVGRLIHVAEPPEWWFESPDGDLLLKVEMPEGTDAAYVPLEVLMEVELDGRKVVSWKR